MRQYSKILVILGIFFVMVLNRPIYGQALNCDFWSNGNSTFHGRAIQEGDEIKAYDPDGILCGTAYYVGDGSYAIHVKGDDPTTPDQDEGASEGDKITFKINGETATIKSGSNVWTNNGSIQCDLDVPGKVGSLTVTINPSDVRSSARWRLTSGPDTDWKQSGETISNIPMGDYTLQFNDVSGWTKPADKTVTIKEGTNTETGNYIKIQYTLTMGVNPSGGGTTEPTEGDHSYDSGTVVNLKAIPSSGYRFINWTGDVADPNSAETTVTVDGNKTVVANFERISHSVLIKTNPSGLKFRADGDEYTAPHTFSWLEGDTHTISVDSPQGGGAGVQYVYTDWTDGGAQSHTYTVGTSDASVTANFKTQYYLTVQSDHDSPTGEGWYDSGTTANFGVTSPADEANGTWYVFTNWSGDSNGSEASGTVVMDGPKTVTANWKTQYYLTVQSDHDSPTGEGWYDSGATANFGVTSPADEANGTRYVFTNWSGDFNGTEASGSVVMDAPKTITANWKTQYYLSTAVDPEGAGTVDPAPQGPWYDSGQVVQLKATPIGDNDFHQWLGDLSGSENPASITMSKPMSITAEFGVWVDITIKTDPENLKFQADGQEYSSSKTFHWKVGSSHSVNAISPQSESNGMRYVWKNWSDGKEQSHEFVTPSTSGVLTANFAKQFYLTIKINPPNAGTTDKQSGWYDSGRRISITASEKGSYEFKNWTGDISSNEKTISLVVNSPLTVQANFQAWYSVTVGVDIPTNAILKIKVDGIEHKAPYVFSAKPNSIHTIDAVSPQPEGPGRRYVFLYWSDKGNKEHQITISKDGMKFIAKYELQFKLTLTINPPEGGSVQTSINDTWISGWKTDTLTAVPNNKYSFNGWSGDQSGDSNPIAVYMDGAKNIIANFVYSNHAPSVISVKISPAFPLPNTSLNAQYRYFDPDGDVESGSEFSWYRNGEKITELNGKLTVPADMVKLGDIWQFAIIPNDGEQAGEEAYSNKAIVVPQSPQKIWLFSFTGNDTTIKAGDDTLYMTLHLMLQSNGLEKNIGNIAMNNYIHNKAPIAIAQFEGSDKFYFNNTMKSYFLISSALKDFTSDISFKYSEKILHESGILSEKNLVLGWTENMGDSWNYIEDAACDTINNIISANGLNHFSLWAVGVKEFSKFFPVELSSFEVKFSKSGEVEINWITKSESNNFGFEIERSNNKKEFKSIGFIKGMGTTNNLHTYRFQDQVRQPGQYYYRLKQIDLDGSFSYSKILSIKVEAPEKFELYQNYPNPFNPTTKITFAISKPAQVLLVVYNLRGEKVATLENRHLSAGFYTVTWDGRNAIGEIVPSGLYFCKIKAGSYQHIIRMLLLK